MAKQKKYHLSLDQEIDFDMLGISSHHNDYRLAWSINAELNMSLELSNEQYIVSTTKKGLPINYSFPMYEFHDEENHLDYYLVKNKSEGKYLIPEKPALDFFLFICEREMIDIEEFARRLRKVSSILAVFPFQAEEFESAEKLVFN